MTNADKIRAMTDEELAKKFILLNCADCPVFKQCYNKCEVAALKWLKQEVEE